MWRIWEETNNGGGDFPVTSDRVIRVQLLNLDTACKVYPETIAEHSAVLTNQEAGF